MNTPRWIAVWWFATSFAATAFAADLSIQNLMTPDEFDESGLRKLTPAELEALNEWLVRYTAHQAPFVRQTSPDVKKEAAVATPPQTIRTQIDGHFNGWSGKTTFRLKNGQVWRQRLPGVYVASLTDPEVEIYQKALGFYFMKILSTGVSVGVAPAE